MKVYAHMKKLPLLLLTAAVAACDYLDVIPPEQQTLDDTMKDATAVESWLYSCYGEAPYMSRIEYLCSTDEWCLPTIFNDFGQTIAWNQLNSSSVWTNNDTTWTGVYSVLGQCNLFLKRLAEADPLGVTEEMKNEYRAEMSFLVGYYHMRPCSSTDRSDHRPLHPSEHVARRDSRSLALRLLRGLHSPQVR